MSSLPPTYAETRFSVAQWSRFDSQRVFGMAVFCTPGSHVCLGNLNFAHVGKIGMRAGGRGEGVIANCCST